MPDPVQRPRLRVIVAIGLAAGALGGLFGVGGGLILVPGLMTFAGFERRLAHGTSLGAILPISFASFLTYLAAGNVDWPAALLLASGSIVGAIVGTRLLRVVPKRVLTIVFVVTVLATAGLLLIGDETSGRTDLNVWNSLALVGVGLFAGTLAGLIGIGGGIIVVPALVVGFHEIPVIAKGTSAAVIVPTSIMGTIRNRSSANVDLRTAAIVGGSGAVTAVLGGIASEHLSDTLSNIMFAVLLVIVAISQLLTLREPDDEPVVEIV